MSIFAILFMSFALLAVFADTRRTLALREGRNGVAKNLALLSVVSMVVSLGFYLVLMSGTTSLLVSMALVIIPVLYGAALGDYLRKWRA